jgi:hypothetical protein
VTRLRKARSDNDYFRSYRISQCESFYSLRKIKFRIAGVRTETRNKHFPNITLEHYRYANLLAVICVQFRVTSGSSVFHCFIPLSKVSCWCELLQCLCWRMACSFLLMTLCCLTMGRPTSCLCMTNQPKRFTKPININLLYEGHWTLFLGVLGPLERPIWSFMNWNSATSKFNAMRCISKVRICAYPLNTHVSKTNSLHGSKHFSRSR